MGDMNVFGSVYMNTAVLCIQFVEPETSPLATAFSPFIVNIKDEGNVIATVIVCIPA
jgi:hypothetical protein